MSAPQTPGEKSASGPSTTGPSATRPPAADPSGFSFHRKASPAKLLESPEAGALVVGAFVGLVAILFTESVRHVRHLLIMLTGLDGHDWTPEGLVRLVVIVGVGCAGATALGVWLLGEAAPGGMNVSIARYHDGKSLRTRTLWYKLVQAALALGSGSAGGGEGPIGYMGGVAGSTVVKVMKLPPQSRRALLAAGMGAGIASLFKAPMAGAIFAAEVLYNAMGIEAKVLFVSVPACAAAFCVYATMYGFDPALPITAQPFDHPAELVGYAVLGIACALLGRLFHWAIHEVLHLSGSGLRRILFALAGGFLVAGTIAALISAGTPVEKAMALMADGYALFGEGALDPSLKDAVLVLGAAICIRLVFPAIGIGTGTGIGDFAPAVTLGGLTGALVSHTMMLLYPPFAPPVAASAVVGMAAFYGGLSRAPISGVLLVSEITGRYTLMIPALWTSMIAFRLLGRTSFYSAQKERPDPTEDLWRKPTGEDLPVGDILPPARTPIPVFAPEAPATRLILLDVPIAAIMDIPPAAGSAVTAAAPRFLLKSDIENHRQLNVDVHLMKASELARSDLAAVSEDDALSSAFAAMLREGVNALPVRLKAGGYTALTRDEILKHLRLGPGGDNGSGI